MSSKNIHLYQDHYRIFDIRKQVLFKQMFFAFFIEKFEAFEEVHHSFGVSDSALIALN